MTPLDLHDLAQVHPALRPLVCAAWLMGESVPASVKHLAPEDVLAARTALGLHDDDPDPDTFDRHGCGGHARVI